MTKLIDFYFDFISPYSYLAYNKLKSLNKDNQINISYKPILLGGLHNLGGITAPAFNERKMKNMKNDCELIANKNNIKFKWNAKFPINSLYLMRGYLIINDDLKEKYFDFCFDAYWKDNLDISDEKNITIILNNIGFNNENFFNGIKDLKIKEKLKDLTKNAFDKDIFGAPTFVVNNKIFWGQDRLDYAIDELNSKD
jgi:2-hydroxychromene-2-carboxylate isomerase